VSAIINYVALYRKTYIVMLKRCDAMTFKLTTNYPLLSRLTEPDASETNTIF